MSTEIEYSLPILIVEWPSKAVMFILFDENPESIEFSGFFRSVQKSCRWEHDYPGLQLLFDKKTGEPFSAPPDETLFPYSMTARISPELTMR